MELRKSIKKRRIGVLINYLSLIIAVLLFEYCNRHGWINVMIVVEIVFWIVFLVSFVLLYLNTGLWSFIHKPLKKLDEREIELTSESLRYAYAIFTVLTLILLLFCALIETALNIVPVVSLILFAHILPASVIAWTSREV